MPRLDPQMTFFDTEFGRVTVRDGDILKCPRCKAQLREIQHDAHKKAEVVRLVIDFIASMTEQQAIMLYHRRLLGIGLRHQSVKQGHQAPR